MANKNISVVVTDEMREALDKAATEQERNISWIIRKAIEQYLDKLQNTTLDKE